MPAGVDHPQAKTLKSKRKRLEERQIAGTHLVVRVSGSQEFPLCLVVVLREVPAVAFLARATKDIEFVVAQYALGEAVGYESADEIQDSRAIGTPVAEVAHEDEAASVGMDALGVVAEPLQEVMECINFAMDIADKVEGAFNELGDKRHGVP
jgi:hypothetical protein